MKKQQEIQDQIKNLTLQRKTAIDRIKSGNPLTGDVGIKRNLQIVINTLKWVLKI